MNISIQLSRKIRLGSLIGAILVVWLHTSNEPIEKGNLGWWAYELIEYGLCPLAVPFFFCVSGFFVGKKMSADNWYEAEVRKRVYSLLVPYVLWNVLFALFCAALNIGANHVAGRTWSCNTIFASGAACEATVALFYKHPFEGSTWYLRSLFIFVLLSPVIRILLDKTKGWGLSLLFCAYLLIIPGEVPRSELWVGENWGYFFWGVFSLQGLFYFSLGMWLSWYECRVNHQCAYLCGAGYLIALLLLANMHLQSMSLVSFGICPAPFVILLGLIFWSSIFAKWYLRFEVANISLPIYLLHQFGICVSGMVMRRLATEPSLTTSLINFLITLTVTLIMYAVLRRISPVWHLLSGRRT